MERTNKLTNRASQNVDRKNICEHNSRKKVQGEGNGRQCDCAKKREGLNNFDGSHCHD